MVGESRIVLVLQNNIPQLPERYLLGYAAATWCRHSNQTLIDTTRIVAHEGMRLCLPQKDDGQWDYQHFTPFMKDRIRDEILSVQSSVCAGGQRAVKPGTSSRGLLSRLAARSRR
jgi:hypothetical protein